MLKNHFSEVSLSKKQLGVTFLGPWHHTNSWIHPSGPLNVTPGKLQPLKGQTWTYKINEINVSTCWVVMFWNKRSYKHCNKQCTDKHFVVKPALIVSPALKNKDKPKWILGKQYNLQSMRLTAAFRCVVWSFFVLRDSEEIARTGRLLASRLTCDILSAPFAALNVVV